jgi:hypothetical protein
MRMHVLLSCAKALSPQASRNHRARKSRIMSIPSVSARSRPQQAGSPGLPMHARATSGLPDQQIKDRGARLAVHQQIQFLISLRMP